MDRFANHFRKARTFNSECALGIHQCRYECPRLYRWHSGEPLGLVDAAGLNRKVLAAPVPMPC